MYPIKRLLVGLDFADLDQDILNFTAMLVDRWKVEKVYFMYIAKELDIPEEVREKYAEVVAPKDEAIQHDMQAEVEKYFKPTQDCEKAFEVKEGNPTDQILKWSGIKEIDLIVMGRKIREKGSGILPDKLAKMGHASLLMVPDNAPKKINKILVPVDYSEHSKMTIDLAESLRKDEKDVEIILQNVYHVPSGYHYSGKSYEEFAEIMKKNAEKDFKKFLKKYEIPDDQLTCIYTQDEDEHPADKIYAAADEQKTDLIMIGSRGRSGLASILIGSIAEKLIKFDKNIPLLIVKDKEENMGFLEALMKI